MELAILCRGGNFFGGVGSWADKWYFPLAEARKKRKMFSHTRLGPEEIRVLAGGAGSISTFLLLLGKA